MTNKNSAIGFLRQLVINDLTGQNPPRYPLSSGTEMVVGRDPRCQVVLDSNRYGMVSRRHAAIRPLSGGLGWEIHDLGSANGTYINGSRLQDRCRLRVGDRITLGQNGPEFIFEAPPVASAPQSESATFPLPNTLKRPPSAPVRSQPKRPESADTVTLTQLFPIFSTGRDLARKAYFIPASITAIVVVLLFSVQVPTLFNLVLGGYMAGIAYYYVYQLCGKHKPWWLLLGAAVLTALLARPLVTLFGPFFYRILAGWAPGNSLWALLVRETLGTGLLEELIKALPIAIAFQWGRLLRATQKADATQAGYPPHPHFNPQSIGVWEPLDGILLGTAAAIGFTLVETLGLYVPSTIQSAVNGAEPGLGYLAGLQLLIPRVLGSVSGHMAYSGYLGYFVGLSVLKRRKRWRILGVGYFTAALLHGLWNATGHYFFTEVSQLAGAVALALIGMLSYAFLAAAILKARALSPTREQNFATRMW
ncbi:PrsW family glutamic-type intramembrane protease [Geitlerinema calcuttense]|uniref:PrsW family glutamic-type intramembrane protease n=1 Tax=Geitlerinema calcuttense NRMC-F 0142 TaxID=2922238 RepID=A0ABT7M2D4_9CYAN|nr:PrsW family glutamic-type intramembrane protease [Geitlerinema calcuttense]MCD8485536.1 PrsW family glutamic-type intramembrane protease [Desertifilum sp.]MDI9635970.1 PrsW family glutamic-type intramembrane protease [Geitlerinema splendidum]MDL5057795.1 PrsW family glutamic-type intramembrane protease [Geitlerinema calcuttense NRMC-F 0142]